MKRLALSLFILLLVSSAAFGQGIAVAPQTAFKTINGLTYPIANATITICAGGTAGIPCAPVLTNAVFNDILLTQPKPNPFTSDAQGNYTFAILPGVYTITVTSTGFAGYSYQLTVAGGGSSGSGLGFLIRTNSPNGTITNYLTGYDTTHVDGNGIAEVQTVASGAKNVIGVCISGCGTSGLATIATYLAANCVTDNQSTVGDLVSASSTVNGQCDDYGATFLSTVQTVGRISKANTGAGTQSLVDFFLGDLNGPGGAGTVTSCASGAGANAFYPNIGSVVSCDPLVTDNNAGGLTAQSYTANNVNFAGFINLIQGNNPPTAPSNGIQIFGPSVITGYKLQLPGQTGTGCLQANSITGGFQVITTGVNCGSGTLPTSTIATPAAPTLTVQGTTGARSITYLVVGCQDGSACAFHTPASGTTQVTNANATLSSTNNVLLSAYADTLYGPRCYNIYVTQDSGGRATGLIANCVWKKFVDTGAAGDTTTAPSTNTTVLWQTPLPLPGCNIAMGQPTGIDAPPCSPNAMDDEFTWGNGTFQPGDVNDPQWTWVHQSVATATLTNGLVSLQMANQASNQLSCLIQPLPAAPYTFVMLVYSQTLGSAGLGQPTSVGFYESGTGKFVTFDILNQIGLQVSHWTNSTTYGSSVFTSSNPWASLPLNIKLARSGSNLNISHSQDGIVYTTAYTETVTNFFTTAPDNIALCINPHNGTTNTLEVDYDYFRRTQ